MEQLQAKLKLLREIHQNHLATVGGYRPELILSNDLAWVALINGDELAVWRFADMARCVYERMEIPNNVTAAADLVKLVTVPNPNLAAA